MRDLDIRTALVAQLRQEEPDSSTTRVWSELAIELGASRVDVCMISNAISGYEIKSPRDNFGRLGRQIEHYGRVLDFASIAVAKDDVDRARAVIPAWWGIVSAAESQGQLTLTVRRKPKLNRGVQPLSIAQLLWRDEALAYLKSHGHAAGLSSATRWAIWDRLVETTQLPELQQLVRSALKSRPQRLADRQFEPGGETLQHPAM